MGFREIRTSERITDQFEETRKRESENWRKIKPVFMTHDEALAYMQEIFRRAAEEAEIESAQ